MKTIWYLFVLIMGVGILVRFILENNHSKPKKDVFSGGEAGDIIIERSDDIKEEIKEGYGIQGGLWAENPYIETVTGRDENNNVIYSYVRERKNKEEKNMREIKVGDKVEIVNDIDETFYNKMVFGAIYTVEDIRIEKKTGKSYAILKETTDRPYLFNCKLVNEKEKQLKKSDLKSGDMVELRNGQIYIFIKDAKRNQYDNPTDIFMGVNSYRCIPFSHYNDNLLNSKEGKSYDIMKMSDGFYISNIFRAYPSDTFKTPDWVWEREETEEMTLEEVCKELGRDIKIVKEH